MGFKGVYLRTVASAVWNTEVSLFHRRREPWEGGGSTQSQKEHPAQFHHKFPNFGVLQNVQNTDCVNF
jgi:hypothetical protein